MGEYDYLNELQPTDQLEALASMIDALLEARKDVADCEAELVKAKEHEKQLSQVEIPNLILANGISEIRLKDGRKVSVKEDISVTITDEPAFFEFLRKRKQDDIIKLNVAFAKMPGTKQASLLKFLAEKDYEYDVEKSVHAQTRKKFFRILLGIGDDAAKGSTDNQKLVEGFAKVFRFHLTNVETKAAEAK